MAAAPRAGAAARDRHVHLSLPPPGKKLPRRRQLPRRPRPLADLRLPGNWLGTRPLGRHLPSPSGRSRQAALTSQTPTASQLLYPSQLECSPPFDPVPARRPPIGDRLSHERGPQHTGLPVSLLPQRGADSSPAFSRGMSARSSRPGYQRVYPRGPRLLSPLSRGIYPYGPTLLPLFPLSDTLRRGKSSWASPTIAVAKEGPTPDLSNSHTKFSSTRSTATGGTHPSTAPGKCSSG